MNNPHLCLNIGVIVGQREEPVVLQEVLHDILEVVWRVGRVEAVPDHVENLGEDEDEDRDVFWHLLQFRVPAVVGPGVVAGRLHLPHLTRVRVGDYTIGQFNGDGMEWRV